MAIIEVEEFLKPITDESPSGDNLEYDPAFAELERAARGKEERESAGKKLEAEPPKWPEVAELARELLGRARDLRVAAYLAHAALSVEGLRGLASGLRLIQGLLDTQWDSVHPQLDRDDNDDPTLRMNSLGGLDRGALLQTLIRTPLVEARTAGKFSLRDLRLVTGETAPSANETVPDAALIEAAFMECELDALKATADTVAEMVTTIDSILAQLRERVGVERAPSLDNLTRELRAMQAALAPRLAKRGVAGGDETSPGGGTAPGNIAIGEIKTREDAIRVLDNVSDYFRRNEPSSPVPLLLQRAKRLVAKDFMEILRDLTPDAVSQAEMIGGLRREE